MGNDKRTPDFPTHAADDNVPELDVDDPSLGLDAEEQSPPNRPKRARRDSIELTPSVPGSWPPFEPPTEPAPVKSFNPALRDMRDRYATGDFSGALAVARAILERHPQDAEARRCADNCGQVLTQMFTARLGPFDQVLRVALPREEVRWLSLDHRAGFVLSLVDGVSTIDQILDLSGMPRLDALRILHTLLEQRVIALDARH